MKKTSYFLDKVTRLYSVVNKEIVFLFENNESKSLPLAFFEKFLQKN